MKNLALFQRIGTGLRVKGTKVPMISVRTDL